MTLKIEKWDVEQVASWVKGLDSIICHYSKKFKANGITGKQLLILDHHDLSKIGITKVGHQEAILESLELLLSINNELNSCNLQSLALTVICRIGYVHRILEQQDVLPLSGYNRELIDCVCYFTSSVQKLLLWLQSSPFSNMDVFTSLHDSVRKATIAVTSHFSRTSYLQHISKNKSYILNKLAEIESKCDDLVKRCPDSIILTPASLENITVRKRAGETLGLHLQSSQQGIHTIRLIRENTACDSISKLEPGDQIVQVNDQVVIGWQLSHVVDALKENPKEVSLKVRKPPRHFNPLSLNQRRPSPKNTLRLGEELKLKQSTFPKRASKHISEDGSFEGKIKSSSIGEAPANIHVTVDPSSPSAYDDVFSLASTIDSVSSSHAPFDTRNLETNRDEVEGGKALRPTILVNDVWHPENSSIAESQPLSAAVSTGKREVLSTFHVVKSTPELRTPEAQREVAFPSS